MNPGSVLTSFLCGFCFSAFFDFLLIVRPSLFHGFSRRHHRLPFEFFGDSLGSGSSKGIAAARISRKCNRLMLV